MKKSSIDFECPICKTLIKVEFAKPSHFTSTFSSARCKKCEAGYSIKFISVKSEPHKVKIEPTMNWMTPKTVDFVKSEFPEVSSEDASV